MFDEKKINFNHIKSFKSNNKKVDNFFYTVSDILIENALDQIKINKNSKILEIGSRNNIFEKKIRSKGIEHKFYQTTISEKILLKNNYRLVANSYDQTFKKNIFDVCFCLFSLNSCKNIPLAFENIYNILKVNGLFLSVFPSDECFKEFRLYFTDFFKPYKNYSFNPVLDIQTLGNLCSASGFKNVIVDKEEFNFKIFKPEDTWNFIRHIGESNYLSNRKEFKIKKSLYLKFYEKYKKEINKGNLNKNTLSIYFLIGKK
ncbi:MAG: hypothetical protein CMJ06_05335 [Pelagibacterales bacterium]|nr:hypothetical protein [Pelagibacterales bacterium]OUU61581.1 MAG: hypothetical protein CBC22_07400 [Alphaproteobacteria bacterium TMED62]|tara:strand:+ start:3011 stop:3787 length:777 start_codon:yes stop_codon:yes gene_type:complete